MPVYTVLIVDDDEEFSQILGLHMARLGYKTIFACDGLEAAAKIHDQHPDLIFLDFQMPNAGGGTVHQWLKNSRDTKAIPVVIISAYPMAEIKKVIPELPHIRFLSKPLHQEDLEAAIRELLDDEGALLDGDVVVDLDQQDSPKGPALD